jgi:trehalose 2-sulfotransferase
MNSTKAKNKNTVRRSLVWLAAHIRRLSRTGAANLVQPTAPIWRPQQLTNVLIFFTPRSGSSWLGEVLTRSTRLGVPEEWLNPDFMPENSAKLKSTSEHDYLSRLQAEWSTKNGVFSIQATYSHIASLTTVDLIEFIAATGKPIFFYLRRRDILRQGISMYLANKTGIFHSTQEQTPSRAEVDLKEVLRCICHIINEELLLETLFIQQNIRPYRLLYEDMMSHKSATLQLFYNVVLGEHYPADEVRTSRRQQTNPQTEEIAAAIRERLSTELIALEKLRPDLHFKEDQNATNHHRQRLNYFHFETWFGAGFIFYAARSQSRIAVHGRRFTDPTEITADCEVVQLADERFGVRLPLEFFPIQSLAQLWLTFDAVQYQLSLPSAPFVGHIDAVSKSQVVGWFTPISFERVDVPAQLIFGGGRDFRLPVMRNREMPELESISNNGGSDGFFVRVPDLEFPCTLRLVTANETTIFEAEFNSPLVDTQR